jgi:hypothetical protein
MPVIATYTEKRLWHCRTFDLYEDHLHIHVDERGKAISEDKLYLKDINPEGNILHIKDNVRDYVLIFITFSSLLGLLYYLFGAFKDEPNKMWWLLAGLAVLFIVNALGLIFPNRKLFYEFKRNNGMFAFHIGRYGKYVNKYDEFVRTLVNQIKSKQLNS